MKIVYTNEVSIIMDKIGIITIIKFGENIKIV